MELFATQYTQGDSQVPCVGIAATISFAIPSARTAIALE